MYYVHIKDCLRRGVTWGGGQKIPEVVLKTPGTGPDGKPGLLTYKMSDVVIISYEPGSSQESVTLGFAKISVTYTAQKK